MKNWKTTAIGILTVVSVISTDTLNFLKTGAFPNLSTDIPIILTAIGIILSKDFNVSGNGTGAVTGQNAAPVVPPTNK